MKAISFYSEVISADRNSRRKITASNLGVLNTEGWSFQELTIAVNQQVVLENITQLVYISCDYPIDVKTAHGAEFQTFYSTRIFAAASAMDSITLTNNNDVNINVKTLIV